MVPGQNVKDPNARYKLMLICSYSLFGMATLGMCFNVMQSAAKRNIIALFKAIRACVTYLCTAHKKEEEPVQLSEVDIQRERQQLINNIKLLKQYQAQMKNRRKKHVMAFND